MFANLKAEIARAEITQQDLADAIGISGKSLSNKINGKTDFTHEEMVFIAKRLTSDKRPSLSLDYLFEKE